MLLLSCLWGEREVGIIVTTLFCLWGEREVRIIATTLFCLWGEREVRIIATQNFTCVEKMVALRCAQGSAFGGKFNWRECQGCLLNLAESRPTPMT